MEIFFFWALIVSATSCFLDNQLTFRNMAIYNIINVRKLYQLKILEVPLIRSRSLGHFNLAVVLDL